MFAILRLLRKNGRPVEGAIGVLGISFTKWGTLKHQLPEPIDVEQFGLIYIQ